MRQREDVGSQDIEAFRMRISCSKRIEPWSNEFSRIKAQGVENRIPPDLVWWSSHKSTQWDSLFHTLWSTYLQLELSLQLQGQFNKRKIYR